jgi:two-component system, chemotaxis family, chemotaxis protein CheY
MNVQKAFAELSILLVDDNSHMRTLMHSMLRTMGIKNIAEAGDTRKSLQIFSQYPIDFILCDIQLEGISGLNLLKAVRDPEKSRDPYVPIIMVTGYAEPRYIAEARDAGCHEFMVKPITQKALQERMLTIITTPRPFVSAEHYFGPDRRRRQLDPPSGKERRGGATQPNA